MSVVQKSNDTHDLFCKKMFVRLCRPRIAGISEYFKNNARLKLHQDLGPVYTIPFSYGNGMELLSCENGIV